MDDRKLFSFFLLTRVKEELNKSTLLNNIGVSSITYYIYSFVLQIEHKSLTLGEVLDGDRMAVSLYDVNFKGERI